MICLVYLFILVVGFITFVDSLLSTFSGQALCSTVPHSFFLFFSVFYCFSVFSFLALYCICIVFYCCTQRANKDSYKTSVHLTLQSYVFNEIILYFEHDNN